MSAEFDHLAICCTALEEGAAAIEDLLGVPLAPGGQHPDFGTHNRLLSLGPGEYLEVIAVNPAAPPPSRARWFDLDQFSGPPRLTNWVARVGDLPAACAAAPDGIGEIHALSRGAYRWRMAVPADGRLPLDGLHPALIAWDGPHPADALPDRGFRLQVLEIHHPEADRFGSMPGLHDARISALPGPLRLAACIATPKGEVWL